MKRTGPTRTREPSPNQARRRLDRTPARSRRRTRAPGPASPPASVAELRASLHHGRALPLGLRERLEASLSVPLTHVRLHTDARAGELARAHAARAVTLGHDIALADGPVRADTPAALELIAHEVAHTLQVSAPPAAGAPVRVSTPGDAAERAADAAAVAVREGRRASLRVVGGPATLYRKAKVEAETEAEIDNDPAEPDQRPDGPSEEEVERYVIDPEPARLVATPEWLHFYPIDTGTFALPKAVRSTLALVAFRLLGDAYAPSVVDFLESYWGGRWDLVDSSTRIVINPDYALALITLLRSWLASVGEKAQLDLPSHTIFMMQLGVALPPPPPIALLTERVLGNDPVYTGAGLSELIGEGPEGIEAFRRMARMWAEQTRRYLSAHSRWSTAVTATSLGLDTPPGLKSEMTLRREAAEELAKIVRRYAPIHDVAAQMETDSANSNDPELPSPPKRDILFRYLVSQPAKLLRKATNDPTVRRSLIEGAHRFVMGRSAIAYEREVHETIPDYNDDPLPSRLDTEPKLQPPYFMTTQGADLTFAIDMTMKDPWSILADKFGHFYYSFEILELALPESTYDPKQELEAERNKIRTVAEIDRARSGKTDVTQSGLGDRLEAQLRRDYTHTLQDLESMHPSMQTDYGPGGVAAYYTVASLRGVFRVVATVLFETFNEIFLPRQAYQFKNIPEKDHPTWYLMTAKAGLRVDEDADTVREIRKPSEQTMLFQAVPPKQLASEMLAKQVARRPETFKDRWAKLLSWDTLLTLGDDPRRTFEEVTHLLATRDGTQESVIKYQLWHLQNNKPKRETPQEAKLREARIEELRKLASAHDQRTEDLGGRGTELPVSFVHTETGSTRNLVFRVARSEPPSNFVNREMWTVADLTKPKGGLATGCDYDNIEKLAPFQEAIVDGILQILTSAEGYGRGYAAVLLPTREPSGTRLGPGDPGEEYVIEVGQSFGEIASGLVDDATKVLTIAALVAAPLTGGLSLGLLAPIGILGATVSSYHLYTRWEQGILELDTQTITEIVDILSTMVGGVTSRISRRAHAAAHNALIYQSTRSLGVVRLHNGLLITGFGLDATGMLLAGGELIAQLETLDGLPSALRRIRVMEIFGQALMDFGVPLATKLLDTRHLRAKARFGSMDLSGPAGDYGLYDAYGRRRAAERAEPDASTEVLSADVHDAQADQLELVLGAKQFEFDEGTVHWDIDATKMRGEVEIRRRATSEDGKAPEFVVVVASNAHPADVHAAALVAMGMSRYEAGLRRLAALREQIPARGRRSAHERAALRSLRRLRKTLARRLDELHSTAPEEIHASALEHDLELIRDEIYRIEEELAGTLEGSEHDLEGAEPRLSETLRETDARVDQDDFSRVHGMVAPTHAQPGYSRLEHFLDSRSYDSRQKQSRPFLRRWSAVVYQLDSFVTKFPLLRIKSGLEVFAAAFDQLNLELMVLKYRINHKDSNHAAFVEAMLRGQAAVILGLDADGRVTHGPDVQELLYESLAEAAPDADLRARLGETVETLEAEAKARAAEAEAQAAEADTSRRTRTSDTTPDADRVDVGLSAEGAKIDVPLLAADFPTATHATFAALHPRLQSVLADLSRTHPDKAMALLEDAVLMAYADRHPTRVADYIDLVRDLELTPGRRESSGPSPELPDVLALATRTGASDRDNAIARVRAISYLEAYRDQRIQRGFDPSGLTQIIGELYRINKASDAGLLIGAQLDEARARVAHQLDLQMQAYEMLRRFAERNDMLFGLSDPEQPIDIDPLSEAFAAAATSYREGMVRSPTPDRDPLIPERPLAHDDIERLGTLDHQWREGSEPPTLPKWHDWLLRLPSALRRRAAHKQRVEQERRTRLLRDIEQHDFAERKAAVEKVMAERFKGIALRGSLGYMERVVQDLELVASTEAGRAVLDAIAASGRTVEIGTPTTKEAAAAVKHGISDTTSAFVAGWGAIYMVVAKALGKDGPADIAGVDEDGNEVILIGPSAGGDSNVFYNPFLYLESGDRSAAGTTSDADLFHELVHARDMAEGTLLTHVSSQMGEWNAVWSNMGEYDTIGLENIYRMQRIGVHPWEVLDSRVSHADVDPVVAAQYSRAANPDYQPEDLRPSARKPADDADIEVELDDADIEEIEEIAPSTYEPSVIVDWAQLETPSSPHPQPSTPTPTGAQPAAAAGGHARAIPGRTLPGLVTTRDELPSRNDTLRAWDARLRPVESRGTPGERIAALGEILTTLSDHMSWGLAVQYYIRGEDAKASVRFQKRLSVAQDVAAREAATLQLDADLAENRAFKQRLDDHMTGLAHSLRRAALDYAAAVAELAPLPPLERRQLTRRIAQRVLDHSKAVWTSIHQPQGPTMPDLELETLTGVHPLDLENHRYMYDSRVDPSELQARLNAIAAEPDRNVAIDDQTGAITITDDQGNTIATLVPDFAGVLLRSTALELAPHLPAGHYLSGQTPTGPIAQLGEARYLGALSLPSVDSGMRLLADQAPDANDTIIRGAYPGLNTRVLALPKPWVNDFITRLFFSINPDSIPARIWDSSQQMLRGVSERIEAARLHQRTVTLNLRDPTRADHAVEDALPAVAGLHANNFDYVDGVLDKLAQLDPAVQQNLGFDPVALRDTGARLRDLIRAAATDPNHEIPPGYIRALASINEQVVRVLDDGSIASAVLAQVGIDTDFAARNGYADIDVIGLAPTELPLLTPTEIVTRFEIVETLGVRSVHPAVLESMSFTPHGMRELGFVRQDQPDGAIWIRRVLEPNADGTGYAEVEQRVADADLGQLERRRRWVATKLSREPNLTALPPARPPSGLPADDFLRRNRERLLREDPDWVLTVDPDTPPPGVARPEPEGPFARLAEQARQLETWQAIDARITEIIRDRIGDHVQIHGSPAARQALARMAIEWARPNTLTRAMLDEAKATGKVITLVDPHSDPALAAHYARLGPYALPDDPHASMLVVDSAPPGAAPEHYRRAADGSLEGVVNSRPGPGSNATIVMDPRELHTEAVSGWSIRLAHARALDVGAHELRHAVNMTKGESKTELIWDDPAVNEAMYNKDEAEAVDAGNQTRIEVQQRLDDAGFGWFEVTPLRPEYREPEWTKTAPNWEIRAAALNTRIVSQSSNSPRRPPRTPGDGRGSMPARVRAAARDSRQSPPERSDLLSPAEALAAVMNNSYVADDPVAQQSVVRPTPDPVAVAVGESEVRIPTKVSAQLFLEGGVEQLSRSFESLQYGVGNSPNHPGVIELTDSELNLSFTHLWTDPQRGLWILGRRDGDGVIVFDTVFDMNRSPTEIPNAELQTWYELDRFRKRGTAALEKTIEYIETHELTANPEIARRAAQLQPWILEQLQRKPQAERRNNPKQEALARALVLAKNELMPATLTHDPDAPARDFDPRIDYPYGFSSRAEFEAAAGLIIDKLQAALRLAYGEDQAGAPAFADLRVVIAGSSLAGRRFDRVTDYAHTGPTFDEGRISDYDVGVLSRDLVHLAGDSIRWRNQNQTDSWVLESRDFERLGLTQCMREIQAMITRVTGIAHQVHVKIFNPDTVELHQPYIMID